METTTWAKWLRDSLADRGWSQAEFVRQSDGHIKADRISKWLSGKEVASHKFATITANTLGKPRAEALRAAGFPDAANAIENRREKLDAHLFAERPSQGQLVEALKLVPDSDLLRVLQLRANERESRANQAVGVAQGNLSALNVGGSSDTVDPHEIDLTNVALAATKDNSSVKDQNHPDYENESQDNGE